MFLWEVKSISRSETWYPNFTETCTTRNTAVCELRKFNIDENLWHLDECSYL